ncbi:MAG: hypothetical protein ACI8PB_005322 [Desulforhopalus sp.]|jgi:hypothetical protein
MTDMKVESVFEGDGNGAGFEKRNRRKVGRGGCFNARLFF